PPFCDRATQPGRAGTPAPTREREQSSRKRRDVLKAPASHRQSERGVALLTVLLSVALMTMLVVDLTYATSSAYRSAANQANELRADYLARSGVQVGLALLAKDARDDALKPPQLDS